MVTVFPVNDLLRASNGSSPSCIQVGIPYCAVTQLSVVLPVVYLTLMWLADWESNVVPTCISDMHVPASIQFCSLHHVVLFVLSAPVALILLTSINRDYDDGSVPLDCEGHDGHLAHPAAADVEDGFLTALTCLMISITCPP